MSTIHFHQNTTSTPEQIVAGLTDCGPGRSTFFGNSADEYLRVHKQRQGYRGSKPRLDQGRTGAAMMVTGNDFAARRRSLS